MRGIIVGIAAIWTSAPSTMVLFPKRYGVNDAHRYNGDYLGGITWHYEYSYASVSEDTTEIMVGLQDGVAVICQTENDSIGILFPKIQQ